MATIPNLFSIAAQLVLVAAIAFGIFALVISHLRYQELFKSSSVLERSGPTGLLEQKIAGRVGSATRETQPFSLLLFKAQQWDQISHSGSGPALMEFLREKISGALRRTDSFIDYGDDRLAAVVDVPLASVPPVINRINDGIRKEVFRAPDGTATRVAISTGVSACPEDGHRPQLLRENAEATLATALAQPALVQYSVRPPAPPPHLHTEQDLPEDQRGLVDPLTGVLREELLESAVQKYVARYRDGEFPCSVICLDVDYLRRYNEQYGEKIGDAILKQISQHLQVALREADLIGRCDGDQFVIVLCAKPQEAFGVAQRLATAIKRLSFQASGAPLKVAVSGGVAGYPDHGGGGGALFLAATAALRAAKSRGRSTVVMYHFDMKLEAPKKERVDVF
jgi:diguanylate cyclase (GGDEF)-like protein